MRNSLFALPLLLSVAGGCSNHDAGPAPSQRGSAADAPPPAPAEPAYRPPETPSAPLPATANAVPEPFRGRYARDGAACERAGDESRLSIEADRIAFHESSGAVVGVSSDGEEAAITARLSGEGDSWERTYRFRLDDDGRTLVDADGGMRRIRCDTGG